MNKNRKTIIHTSTMKAAVFLPLLLFCLFLPAQRTQAKAEAPAFDEYQASDSLYSPRFIDLSITITDTKNTDGIEIFRKQGKGSYKLIGTIPVIKTKQYGYTYRDRKVKYAKTYTYKLRGYQTAGGQKICSDFSEEFTRRAVKRSGTYKVKLREYSQEGIVLSVRNRKNNGTLIFSVQDLSESMFETGKDEKATLVELSLQAYSYDGEHWKAFGKKCALKAKSDKPLYLRFIPIDEDTVLPPELPKDAKIMINHVIYNDLGYTWFKLRLSAGKGETYPDLEYYH